MTDHVPFSGLAPDTRVARGAGDLEAFDLRAVVAIAQRLRARARSPMSTEELALHVVEALNAFDHDGRQACVLVRAFTTTSLADLPPDLARSALASAPPLPLPPDANPMCLRLVATRGIEPPWNDVASSAAHRALLLDGSTAPMVAELARQLRLGDAHAAPSRSFVVDDPVASEAMPAKSFLKSFDVKQVFGFGVTLAPGATLVFIAFCRTKLPIGSVRLFELVGTYAKVAAVRSDAARLEAFEELAIAHEIVGVAALVDSRKRIEEAGVAARKASAEAKRLAREHAESTRRGQRALLNVIQDLREARNALSTTVETRTRELATANRQLEARNRELEEFVYIASHDLQEPLRTVAGYLQMIERRYGTKLGVEADEFIRFAIDGAQRMQALIESLLVYSRVATADNRLERLSLDTALDTALQNLAFSIEDTKAAVVREPLPTVEGDRIQFVQLFQNLLGNAFKFAGPNPPRVYVSGVVVDGMCTITVRDEGVGFNPKFSDRIFKVFRRLRRDTPGTGIGLAICKKIVERHAGTIEATGELGRGATFTVRLPVHPPESRS